MRNVYQLEVVEATDFTQSFLYNNPTTGLPVNLTNYHADLRIKQAMNGNYDGYGSAESVLELSDVLGGITLGGTTGLITITFTAAQLTATTWNRGVYSLNLTDPTGLTSRFMYGFITILQDTVN